MSTDDAVLKALQAQKEIAVLKKTIAESERDRAVAQKDTSLANLATPAAEGRGPLKGDATVSPSAGLYLGEWLASRSLSDGAAALAKSMKKPGNKDTCTIFILGDGNYVNDLLARRQLDLSLHRWLRDLTLLKTELEARPTREVMSMVAPLLIAQAVLSGLSNIRGFFQSEYTLAAVAVSKDVDHVARCVAGELVRQGFKVRLPSLGHAQLPNVLREIDSIVGLVVQCRQIVAAIQSSLPEDSALTPEEKALVSADRSLIHRATSMLEQWEHFLTSIVTRPSGNEPSQLERATRLGELPQPGDLILSLCILNVGALESRQRTLWFSPKVDYLAGATIGYTLFKPEGAIVESDVTGGLTHRRFDWANLASAAAAWIFGHRQPPPVHGAKPSVGSSRKE